MTQSPGFSSSRTSCHRPSSTKLFELRPFFAWFFTIEGSTRNLPSAMPQPHSGIAVPLSAIVESPIMKMRGGDSLALAGLVENNAASAAIPMKT